MERLENVTENIWHAQHHFPVNGVPISSRMSVIRVGKNQLLIHSPVPVDEPLARDIQSLGKVCWIVAPSKTHHLFVPDWQRRYPDAALHGAPGLKEKRPDLSGLITLDGQTGPWAPELEYHLFGGIPFGNETVWFHPMSGTLILTDLCQWWQGDLSRRSAVWNRAMGVRNAMQVPRSVRWLVRDRAAAAASAKKILAWPVQTVVLGHNAIVRENAKPMLKTALSPLLSG